MCASASVRMCVRLFTYHKEESQDNPLGSFCGVLLGHSWVLILGNQSSDKLLSKREKKDEKGEMTSKKKSRKKAHMKRKDL